MKKITYSGKALKMVKEAYNTAVNPIVYFQGSYVQITSADETSFQRVKYYDENGKCIKPDWGHDFNTMKVDKSSPARMYNPNSGEFKEVEFEEHSTRNINPTRITKKRSNCCHEIDNSWIQIILKCKEFSIEVKNGHVMLENK